VRFEMAGVRRDLDFSAEAAPQRIELDLRGPTRLRDQDGTLVWAYRLRVASDRGAVADVGGGDDHEFLHGATLLFLGTREELGADLYRVEWLEVASPPVRPKPGETIPLPVRLRNASGEPWRARGGGHVALSYHWRRDDGTLAVLDGRRTVLPGDLGPGEELALTVAVAAPTVPGRYRLELDLVRERVAWFSERRPETVHRLEVEIAP
jgi:hypothetical protein